MQSFTGWNGDTIEVSDSCPTASLDWILGRTHIMEPASEIEADVRRRIADAPRSDDWTSEQIEEAVTYALWRHDQNRNCYRDVMNGTV